MQIERVWEMPNKHTFAMKCVQRLFDQELDCLKSIDPFSGLHSPADIRNDADIEKEADRHEDGLEFLRSFNGDDMVDGVLFDPPYSVEQALRIYKPRQNGTAGRAEYWAKCKDEIARFIMPRGIVISFGWDSNGMGKGRGFEITRILLICHGACHNDTIVTVERKSYP